MSLPGSEEERKHIENLRAILRERPQDFLEEANGRMNKSVEATRLIPRRWHAETWVCSMRGHCTPAAYAEPYQVPTTTLDAIRPRRRSSRS